MSLALGTVRRSRRLQPVPELGPYEINVGALSTAHVGQIIAVRRGRNTLTGPLLFPPAKSVTKPLLVLRLGEFSVALHPAAAVMVVPEGYKTTITIAPRGNEAPNRSAKGS
ncbi:hypothetical protein HG717_34050 [Rhodococcus erythropolis]|uniref:hypothetical protein n=1 Tax=Rhodococcus erythropolis TaxID=1833 RepID=UPI001C9A63C0|nr:hypothetical protein [Rhodococcus erythropolis]MBY6388893.1 hypothetical protein [Rhodococcus erythropolis]